MKLEDLETMQAGAWRAVERAVEADDARTADPALSRFQILSQAVFTERMARVLAEQSRSMDIVAKSLLEIASLARNLRRVGEQQGMATGEGEQ